MLNNKKFLARLMAFLQHIDPKKPLPKELEPELWARMEDELFTKKLQEIVAQGEVPDKAIFLLAGYMIVYYIDEDGEVRVVRIYKAEQIIATDAFMRHTKSPYYIVAARQAVMISISYFGMQHICQTIPAVDELARKTAASYEKLEKQRDILMNKSNREKILEFYSDKKDLLPPKRSPVPDKYIASYLRINLYTFRRIRGLK